MMLEWPTHGRSIMGWDKLVNDGTDKSQSRR